MSGVRQPGGARSGPGDRNLIPYALGFATSPIAIIAVILMLLSSGARDSASFLVGWLVGVVGATPLFLALARRLPNTSNGSSSHVSAIVEVVLGVLLLVLAAEQLPETAEARGEGGAAEVAPDDRLAHAQRSALVGLASPLGGGLNPTNLLLIAGAMVASPSTTSTRG